MAGAIPWSGKSSRAWTVDAIVNVPTTSMGPHQNVPVKPVVITRARVISELAACRPARGHEDRSPRWCASRCAQGSAPARAKASPSPAGK